MKAKNLYHDNEDYSSIYGDIVILEDIPFIRRSVGDGYLYDLTSVYPFTYEAVQDTAKLLGEVQELGNCVSLTMVSNPLKPLPKRCSFYPDLWFQYCQPFKRHYIVNLPKSNPNDYSDNHKRNLKKFYKIGNEGIVEVIPQRAITDKLIEKCYKTYLALGVKHGIQPESFSFFTEEQFRRQFFVDNSVLLIARDSLDFAGWSLFHRRDNNMYYHLSATTPHGYKISSSYAILDTAIGLFKQLGFHYFLLGSGAGLDSDPKLEYFKSGWGCHTEKNYIYGWINNKVAYQDLSKDIEATNFFPLYRSK